MQVREILTAGLKSVTRESSIREAARKMRELDVGMEGHGPLQEHRPATIPVHRRAGRGMDHHDRLVARLVRVFHHP